MSSLNLPPDDQAPPHKVSINNQAPNQGMQGIARDVTIHHHHGPTAPPTPTTLTARQRAELLDRLAWRYQELLDHALPHQVRLRLGLHTRPDAVDSAWRRMFLRGPRASSRPVPPGTPVLDLFDGQQGQLLVLGAPGAGKTTLIVELAQALTKRAAADGQARLPVVLNVAAWRSGQSLRDWLTPTLRDLLGASKRFAAQLAASDDLLLLLDGLDEVAADHRAACVSAINAYLTERDLTPPIVVGCRSREYADMGARLAIAGAVELEPLELTAIEQALAEVPAAQGVLAALQTDELLRELAQTPLIVNVALLAYAEQVVPQVTIQTIDVRRQVLWSTYVRRMLYQRQLEHPNQVLRWLRWLACQLREQSETNFLIDDLQPTMVPLGKPPRRYLWIGMVSGSLLGTTFGALVGWATIAIGHINILFQHSILNPRGGAVVLGFLGGLGCGLLGCVTAWLYDSFNDFIRAPAIRLEKIRWSWTHIQEISQVGDFYKSTLPLLIFLGIISTITGFLITRSITGVVTGIVLFIGFIFVIGYFMGFKAEDLADRINPMQGINTSSAVMLITVWPVLLFFSILIGLYFIYLFHLLVLIISLPIFFIVALFCLFQVHIRHYSLRLVLWRAGLFPFHAVTFLNAMTERLLLERDGAFYRFRHLLLRDFIADLSDDDIARLAREIEGSR